VIQAENGRERAVEVGHHAVEVEVKALHAVTGTT
jgi:hypothetical protein